MAVLDGEGGIVVPVPFSPTLFFDAFGISVDGTRLGEISRKMVFSSSRSVCKTGMVAIVMFLGASH
jgi:hypothetical protein